MQPDTCARDLPFNRPLSFHAVVVCAPKESKDDARCNEERKNAVSSIFAII
jgi:hypothetical protein